MDSLFIMCNLGLGDAILQNALFRSLSAQHEQVYIPCHTQNLPSVRFMVSDLENVTVEPTDDIQRSEYMHNCSGHKILRLGCYSNELPRHPETFDQTFYRQAGIAFSKRWDAFKLPELTQWTTVTSEPYALICDSPERGFNVDESRIYPSLFKIRAEIAETIFHHCNLIKNSTELHCINSAPAILADSILTNGKLFFHRYSRPCTPYDNFKLRKNWTIFT